MILQLQRFSKLIQAEQEYANFTASSFTQISLTHNQLTFVTACVLSKSWDWGNCSVCLIWNIQLWFIWKWTAASRQLEHRLSCTAWPVAPVTGRVASASAASVTQRLQSRSPARGIMGKRGGHQRGGGGLRSHPLTAFRNPLPAHALTLSSTDLTN